MEHEDNKTNTNKLSAKNRFRKSLMVCASIFFTTGEYTIYDEKNMLRKE